MGDAGVTSQSGANVGLRLDSKIVGAAAVAVLFLVSLFLWTLPFQQNKLPFGEGDSAWHFAIGDKISSSDKAEFRLPYYVGIWYYGFNRILGPFAPEYPPSSHVNYALVQLFGGERFVPVLIYRAFASFLGAFAVFFVISRLFGVLPGFLAGLGLSFSVREQMTYLFGQQPTLTALVITPVTTYAWYKFLSSFYDKEGASSGKGNVIYLFIAVALLLSQYMLHVQGFAASMVFIAVFTALMAIRFRKLPLSRANIPYLVISALAFLAVAAPFAAIYLGAPENAPVFKFSRLFEWGISPDYLVGSYPPAFTAFSAEYPKFVLPFLFSGLVLLAIRLFLVKSNVRELFLLSWLIGVYIILHMDVFLLSNLARLARMLVLENYVFYSLIALSVAWLPSTVSSILKLDRRIVSAAAYSLAAVLVISLVMTSGKAAYSSLKDAYPGIARVTPAESEFAEWLGANVPEKSYIYDPTTRIMGQWRYAKIRWMLAISQRHIGTNDFGTISDTGHGYVDKDNVYFLFDYSDAALLASSPDYRQQAEALASQLQQVEVSMFNGASPLYDTNNIRLYRHVMPVSGVS